VFVSDATLAEVHEVVGRPKLRRTFIRVTDADVEAFFRNLALVVTRIESVPAKVRLVRDPKDAMYLDLAVATGAEFVVSRDNDLLDLMTSADPDAETFRTAYPTIRVLDPVAFLQTLSLIVPSTPHEAP